jgi:hypothetical protein
MAKGYALNGAHVGSIGKLGVGLSGNAQCQIFQFYLEHVEFVNVLFRAFPGQYSSTDVKLPDRNKPCSISNTDSITNPFLLAAGITTSVGMSRTTWSLGVGGSGDSLRMRVWARTPCCDNYSSTVPLAVARNLRIALHVLAPGRGRGKVQRSFTAVIIGPGKCRLPCTVFWWVYSFVWFGLVVVSY